MKNPSKCPKIWKFVILISLIFLGFSVEFSSLSFSEAQKIEADLLLEELPPVAIFQGDTLLAFPNPTNPPPLPPPEPKKLWVVITAYSSTPCQTDDDPYITAAGTWVREGLVANNLLPLGTKIKIPELFGDQIFVVEDRMHWRKGNYHIDVWFPDYWEALSFGVERTYIEIIEG